MNKLPTVVITAVVALILIATTASLIPNSSEDNEDDLYVFILSGQSNAQYYQENVTVANELDPVPYGTIFYYGSEAQPAEYESDWATTYGSYDIYPMNTPAGTYTIGSDEPGFASQFYKLTGHKCLIINVARGGASISDFVPGAYLYTYAHTLINDALSKIDEKYTIVKASWIWIQGEADRMMSPELYKTQFSKIKADYMGLGFNTTLLSKVRPQWSPSISTTQQEIINKDPSIHGTGIAETFSLTNGTMAEDNLHYSQKGRNILGGELANLTFVKHSQDNVDLSLLQVVPVLMIVGVLMLIVGATMVRRRS